MKKKPKQQKYYRTVALLGAQQQPISRRRTTTRAGSKHTSVAIPWKLIALLMLVGGVVLWFFVDGRWYLMGEDIHVIGASSQKTAYNIALASDLLGWHGLRLRPNAAETLIKEQVAAVEDVTVECGRFPATCLISVTERAPALNWVTENGVYWIDEQGLAFPTAEMRAGLPVVRDALPDAMSSRNLTAVVEGITALTALGVTAETWEYNLDRGLIWTDTEGRRVAFGVGTAMEPRVQMYTALVNHLEARNVFPWTIDVRFPAGPTYSLERLW